MKNMIFDIIKTLVKMMFTIIVLIIMTVLSPLFFLFLTPENALKIILRPIIGGMIVMGYDKDYLVLDVQKETKKFL